MKRFALLGIPLAMFMAAPVSAADLDGPIYRERRTIIEQEAPRVVERRVIEHHHYYQPAPRTVYVEPDVHYVPRVYGYYDRRFRYAGWHHRHFRGWHRRHHDRW
jgi:hypothetical protein